ncbi:MAG: divergent PAP2 family protein [Candidatus Kerfeldbacteria bacterium]
MEYPKIILIPIIAGIIAQASKVVVEAFKTGHIDLRLLNRYGGMPSSHTALVVSLTTVAGLIDGINSTAFVIAFIFSLVTIRDAIGFRMYLGQHASLINKLISELPDAEKIKFPQHIIERIGHTQLEALMGALIGLAATFILWVIVP